ncbi:hypothetical protein BGZ52_003381 [Haplosporangium bisporale]|nr:hypothetical protein BGZ52_003381 [Haplosporangium bisporale]
MALAGITKIRPLLGSMLVILAIDSGDFEVMTIIDSYFLHVCKALNIKSMRPTPVVL